MRKPTGFEASWPFVRKPLITTYAIGTITTAASARATTYTGAFEKGL
jgi:hypothetical protein